MKHNAFTKVFALVLSVMMVVGCLPVSALANDWESEIDKAPVYCPVCLESEEENEVTYVEAVVPANCKETGHNEYWHCEACDAYYGDEECSSRLNPDWINYTGDCVRPEGAIVCAVVACEVCGEDTYGETCDRGDAPVCQDAPCVRCGETVWGWGCNYNTGDEEVPLPLCQPGDCVYCGTHYEKLYDCANGAWAPCLEGECSYGCGAKFPATEAHTVDPCVGGLCETCWETIEGKHDYVDGACSVCGEADPDAPTGPIVDENLKYHTVAISFQEYIGLQTVVKKTVVSEYDSFYVEAVQAGIDGDSTVILSGTAAGSNYYMFSKQILSWDMTDVVTMTLYAEKDGALYKGETVETSVAELAMEKIKGYASSDTKRARALVDMLNYGAAVQTQYNHNAGNLPNKDLGDYAQYGTSETPTFNATTTIDETVQVVPVYRYAMSMQSKVELQFIFKADVTGCELRYTVDGVTDVIPASEFSVNGSYKYAKVAIKAANLRKDYTIGLYNSATGELVSQVYTTSVEAYIQEKLGGTLDAVFYAMMKYGDAVAAI